LKIEPFNFEQSYFDLFGLPVSCEIDSAVLRDNFMNLQRRYHPDRFASSSDVDRRLAVQIAAHVNGAHQTLQQPLKRAEYCLTLAGLSIDAETDSSMDGAFLMQQMELRESLEEVPGATDSYAALDAVRSEIGEMIEVISLQTTTAVNAKEYDTARETVRRWQFLEKLLEEANAVESRLDES